jgi:hypothetical protein
MGPPRRSAGCGGFFNHITQSFTEFLLKRIVLSELHRGVALFIVDNRLHVSFVMLLSIS